MPGATLGNSLLGGVLSTGEVAGLVAYQTILTQARADWDVLGGVDLPGNTVFLVFVDGRLKQRLSGSLRSAHFIAADYNAHQVDVMAWPAWLDPPETNYGAVVTSRAHVQWTRPTDTSIVGYWIYKAATSNGTYTLHDTKTQTTLETKTDELASGALCSILGQYDGTQHTNTLFTLTVIDAVQGVAELTNDANGDMVTITYTVGSQVNLFDGVSAVFLSTPEDGDEITFICGVQPYYDSGILTAGTHWFKVVSFDTAGNPASVTSALAGQTPVGIVITPAPDPVAAFSLTTSTIDTDDTLDYALTQSATSGVTGVNIYSNYDPDTNTVLSGINYDSRFLTVTLAASQSTTGTLLSSVSTKPSGTYQFVARAIGSTGIEDTTADPESVTLPYVADIPTPYNLTATPGVGGTVTLSWVSPSNPTGGWRITGLSVSPITVTPTPSVVAGTDDFGYSTTLTALQVGSEGSHTATLASRNAGGTRFGTGVSVTFTSDATAPTMPTGLNGVPF